MIGFVSDKKVTIYRIFYRAMWFHRSIYIYMQILLCCCNYKAAQGLVREMQKISRFNSVVFVTICSSCMVSPVSRGMIWGREFLILKIAFELPLCAIAGHGHSQYLIESADVRMIPWHELHCAWCRFGHILQCWVRRRMRSWWCSIPPRCRWKCHQSGPCCFQSCPEVSACLPKTRHSWLSCQTLTTNHYLVVPLTHKSSH